MWLSRIDIRVIHLGHLKDQGDHHDVAVERLVCKDIQGLVVCLLRMKRKYLTELDIVDQVGLYNELLNVGLVLELEAY